MDNYDVHLRLMDKQVNRILKSQTSLFTIITYSFEGQHTTGVPFKNNKEWFKNKNLV